MDLHLLYIILIIVIALTFDFTNGAHDAANSIATIVSTKVLSLRQALFFAAFFNFISFLVFGNEVAKTIGKGLVNINIVTPEVVLMGLIAAIVWNLITLYLALPTSSSHALIGGYAGAAIAAAGWSAIIASGWIKIFLFIVLAPLLGFALGYLFIILLTWAIYLLKMTPGAVNYWSRHLQLLSAGLYSLAHGSNDAQKTIGIITGLLVSAGYLSTFDVPLWVVLSAHTCIALGTLYGGKRIIKTMGHKIFKLRPVDGVASESASATSIFLATFLGVPVSTTHVITGAISGVGSAQRFKAVKWGTTIRIVWAWIFTIPGAGGMAFLLYSIGAFFLT
ncbi:MAG: inorganic phosphate transporter [Candidatus Paceibacterota bacterium]|jgi:PiT family inorganic phosphate transporter|nr:inorganic phosphate transporter [Candidatus Paceibacterota bacterium]